MIDSDFELQAEQEEDYQPHRVDDPDVWGLNDVARGRTPEVPTTVYAVSGDSASGVAGLIFPDGNFIPKAGTSIGKVIRFQNGGADDGQMMPKDRVLPTEGRTINAPLPTEGYLETVWTGAMPAQEFQHCDEDTGVCEIRREHSKGLLLGNYPIRREPTRSREMNINKGGRNPHPQLFTQLPKAA